MCSREERQGRLGSLGGRRDWLVGAWSRAPVLSCTQPATRAVPRRRSSHLRRASLPCIVASTPARSIFLETLAKQSLIVPAPHQKPAPSHRYIRCSPSIRRSVASHASIRFPKGRRFPQSTLTITNR